MLRAIRFFSLLLLGTGATLYSPQAVAQALNGTGLEEWDSTNQVLFFVNGLPGFPIRAYTDSHQRGADINIFKDFPGLQEFYGTSLTAGPEGTTLIAATLNFGGQNVREVVLTYDSSGQLLKTWEPAPQYADVIAYSKDDDAMFILGDRDVQNGPDPPDFPLLVEYSRDGHVLKNMVPASTLKGPRVPFDQNGEIGQPALKVTKSHIYFYAPTNREVVMCDRNGTVIAHRSINDIVEKVSTQDGNYLVQTHHVDFSDDGEIVLELLLANNSNGDSGFEVVRINIKTGEAIPVRKALSNHINAPLWFIGLKGGQYLYLEDGKNLYIQSSATQEPVPLDTKQID
jgi:hypothetical protein